MYLGPVTKALGVLFAGILLAQIAVAQTPETNSPVKQHIASLPPHARVEIHLQDGTSTTGRLVSRSENDFVFQPDGSAAARTIAFAQVQSVQQIKPHHSKAKWIILGVVGGAVIVLAVIAIHIAHHHAPFGNGPAF